MKLRKEVEATRRSYHLEPTLNSVHRSSLLVPEIPGSIAEISFLNHFLIKRNNKYVACRITAIDLEGRRIESRQYQIDEPRVYTFTLSGMVNISVSTYLVEFFSSANLFIPFPAVMIMHRGPGFLNQVHAYNRILNDIFEEDVVNKVPVREASIDLDLNENSSTFVIFTAGQFECEGELVFQILTATNVYSITYPLKIKRFGNQRIVIREIFPNLPADIKGVLKIQQPSQVFFYGRLMVGKCLSDCDTFSANHSYYDSSETHEYWDNNLSLRFFPFFQELENRVCLYPIASPSTLRISILVVSVDGLKQREVEVGILTSPGPELIDVSVTSLAEVLGFSVREIGSFAVKAYSDTGRIPTRISQQLIYGKSKLPSSINVILVNSEEFVPTGRNGLTWGQSVIGSHYDSWLGIIHRGMPEPENLEDNDLIEVTFYDITGEIARRTWRTSYGVAIRLSIKEELANEIGNLSDEIPSYIWWVITTPKPVYYAYSVTVNQKTGNCSGEHGF
ncbi:hypothetical protein [Leptospira mayottensis]|uniref:hypothetical protein n=1 Tax=Leptospira mayottensis TaxID=1137606 RepID=UPI0002BFAA59|nr:hypothetical protein [Leptospira mayottensis]AXR61720.1 hypothetical protein DQM68_14580 [Leptospira mayottensis]AZQ01832.1 hypothetical protein LEP1GSC190_07140 [Leptospira mayottensis 200901116]